MPSNIGIELDFVKLRAERHITVALGPTSAVANIGAPTAAELNALQPASQSISWNDWDFGMQASETINDPSLADSDSYEERGAANYGGGISFYYPKEYDDNSNNHSLIYDLTDIPGSFLIIAIRIDGDKPNSTPFATGDYVHVFIVQTDSEANTLTGADALRRTIGMLQQGVFAVYTTVGPHTVAITPATITTTVGSKARVTATMDGREYTNGLVWRSSNTAVAPVSEAGVYQALSAGTATLTAEDPSTGNTDTVVITVGA